MRYQEVYRLLLPGAIAAVTASIITTAPLFAAGQDPDLLPARPIVIDAAFRLIPVRPELTPDLRAEIDAWRRDYLAWRQWAAEWRNRNEPGLFSRRSRRPKPNPPAWLIEVCSEPLDDPSLIEPCALVTDWQSDLVTAEFRTTWTAARYATGRTDEDGLVGAHSCRRALAGGASSGNRVRAFWHPPDHRRGRKARSLRCSRFHHVNDPDIRGTRLGARHGLGRGVSIGKIPAAGHHGESDLAPERRQGVAFRGRQQRFQPVRRSRRVFSHVSADCPVAVAIPAIRLARRSCRARPDVASPMPWSLLGCLRPRTGAKHHRARLRS